MRGATGLTEGRRDHVGLAPKAVLVDPSEGKAEAVERKGWSHDKEGGAGKLSPPKFNRHRRKDLYSK